VFFYSLNLSSDKHCGNGMNRWYHGLHVSGPVHEALSILRSGAIGQMQYHVLTNVMETSNWYVDVMGRTMRGQVNRLRLASVPNMYKSDEHGGRPSPILRQISRRLYGHQSTNAGLCSDPTTTAVDPD
jgi:hypothetical protein